MEFKAIQWCQVRSTTSLIPGCLPLGEELQQALGPTGYHNYQNLPLSTAAYFNAFLVPVIPFKGLLGYLCSQDLYTVSSLYYSCTGTSIF